MIQGPLHDRLIEGFDGMSAQLQLAARYILDHARDVALLSMRAQARRAGVQPATMTRLAKHLKLDGYETIRQLHAEAVRGGALSFSIRADRQVVKQKLKGDHALAAEMAAGLAQQIARLGEPESLGRLAAAAEVLATARSIYCLGMRSSFSVMWQFHYVLSMVRDGIVLFDCVGGLGIDAIRNAASDDVLLVASVRPYARASVEAVDYAISRRLRVVAITDSLVAPVAEGATQLILVSTDNPSFFHAIGPAFAAAEILAALVAGRGGANALAVLRQTERQFSALSLHLDSRKRRKST
jgi:DNA-binding MurR/RpiR family transcriptional regulator